MSGTPENVGPIGRLGRFAAEHILGLPVLLDAALVRPVLIPTLPRGHA